MSDHSVTAVDYEEFCQRGVRYAYSILHNMADAEEAVQEALCRMVGRYPDNGSLPSQAAVYFKIVRNLCIDRLRHRRRFEPIGTDPVDTRRPACDEFEAGSGLDALQERIQLAMAALPEPWSAALRLRVDGRLSYEEIAGVLDCSTAQVRTWIYRGRRQLEREFDDILSAEERR